MQIKKEEKELNRAFGTSAIQAKIEDLSVPQEGRTATIMLFGNARECEVAQVLPLGPVEPAALAGGVNTLPMSCPAHGSDGPLDRDLTTCAEQEMPPHVHGTKGTTWTAGLLCSRPALGLPTTASCSVQLLQVRAWQAMIEEAIENKEQKAKQRAKEYERKREAKWRNRQMYHMRHTRDYEALGLPIGASKVDVKAAYKKLAGESRFSGGCVPSWRCLALQQKR